MPAPNIFVVLSEEAFNEDVAQRLKGCLVSGCGLSESQVFVGGESERFADLMTNDIEACNVSETELIAIQNFVKCINGTTLANYGSEFQDAALKTGLWNSNGESGGVFHSDGSFEEALDMRVFK